MVQQHLLGPTPDAEQSQWFTPDWLADGAVEFSGVQPGDSVCELGAGDGAFVRPLLNAGARVVAVERDIRFVGALKKLQTEDLLLRIDHGDALDRDSWRWGDEFTACTGNPPYENDDDIAFVERGLELAPHVVFVLRLVFLAGQERFRRIWSKHHLEAIAHLPERPAFIGEGSGGAKADFAVFDIRRGPAPPGHRVRTEWWSRTVEKFTASNLAAPSG